LFEGGVHELATEQDAFHGEPQTRQMPLSLPTRDPGQLDANIAATYAGYGITPDVVR
jgi:hypothetical protein